MSVEGMRCRVSGYEDLRSRACGGRRHAKEGEDIRVRACEGMRWRERRTCSGGRGHSSEGLRGHAVEGEENI